MKNTRLGVWGSPMRAPKKKSMPTFGRSKEFEKQIVLCLNKKNHSTLVEYLLEPFRAGAKGFRNFALKKGRD